MPINNDNVSRSLVAEAIGQYCKTLRGLRTTFEITVPLVAGISAKQDQAFEKFVETNKIDREETNECVTYSFPIELEEKFSKIRKRKEQLDVAYFHLPRALVVSLVSAFDSYLADLLRALFSLKPEMIESSGRQFTFKELSEFESIDSARKFLIDKEVEGLIRDSHIAQFDWLEARFGVPLRKGLPSWITFVEVTERRNLYVHTDGIVSDQYLANCKKQGVSVDGLKAGGRLPDLSWKYYHAAWRCLFEIGTKLGHVLWRKITGDLEASDNELIDTIFDLLEDEDYELAGELGHFSTVVIPNHSSALCRKTMLINYCIALRFGGQPDKCCEVLDSEDWSDSDDAFRLAHAVLKHDFAEATRIMKEAGSANKRLTRRNYEMWPLFNDFRKTEGFRSTYRDLFGEEYVVPEAPPRSRDDKKREIAAHADDNSLKDGNMKSPYIAEQSVAHQPATSQNSKPKARKRAKPKTERGSQ